MGKTSGFEQVHGLLDRVMLMLKSAFLTREDGLKNEKLEGYWIEEVDGKSTATILNHSWLTNSRSDFPYGTRSGDQDQHCRPTSHDWCVWDHLPVVTQEIRPALSCQHSGVQSRGLPIAASVSLNVCQGLRYRQKHFEAIDTYISCMN